MAGGRGALRSPRAKAFGLSLDRDSDRREQPLDKLLGYTTDLRSMTRGRGQFTMTFDRFDVA